MQQRVVEWLDKTGQPIPWNVDKDKLLANVKSVFDPPKFMEEVMELDEALRERNLTKVLDAVIDVGYYYYQMVGHLERAGIDYKGAFNAVCSNNDLKYTTSYELVTKWYCEYKMAYRGTAKGEDVIICDSVFNGETFYCLKNKVGKVIKPIGFLPVDLSEFIPSSLDAEYQANLGTELNEALKEVEVITEEDIKKEPWNKGVFPKGRGIWQEDVKTKGHYYELINMGRGMAFELYPTLPLCWELAEIELKKWEEENELN